MKATAELRADTGVGPYDYGRHAALGRGLTPAPSFFAGTKATAALGPAAWGESEAEEPWRKAGSAAGRPEPPVRKHKQEKNLPTQPGAGSARLGCEFAGLEFEFEASEFKLEPSEFELEPSEFELEGFEFELEPSEFKLEPPEFELEGSEFELEASEFELEPFEFELEPSEFKLEASEFELEAFEFELEPSEFKLGRREFKLRPREFKLGGCQFPLGVLRFTTGGREFTTGCRRRPPDASRCLRMPPVDRGGPYNRGPSAYNPAPMPYLYILRCADGSLYTGIAKNLERRLGEHQAGRASRYTRGRLPVALAWSREVPTWSAALKAELQVKALPRAQKEALLAGLPGHFPL